MAILTPELTFLCLSVSLSLSLVRGSLLAYRSREVNRRGTIVISSNPESRFLPLETIEFRGTGTATESLRVGFSIEMGSSNSQVDSNFFKTVDTPV